MKTTLALLALVSSAFAADNVPPDGFVALFNGKDLSGWKVPAGDNGHWKVIDGVIDYDARSESKEDRSLWTEREYSDYTLLVDWRIKETPFINPRMRVLLPDGSEARDIKGQPLALSLPDSDSGVLLCGNARYQLNIWCWPIGSGEMYGVRRDPAMPPEVRAGVTPRTQADKPVGEWNRYQVTVRDGSVRVLLNDQPVLPGVKIPGLPKQGAIGLQHHGTEKDGKWVGPPSLVQFRNVFIKELK